MISNVALTIYVYEIKAKRFDINLYIFNKVWKKTTFCCIIFKDFNDGDVTQCKILIIIVIHIDVIGNDTIKKLQFINEL